MGLGVLDDSHLEHVPGTALLTDVQGINTSPLRHAKGSSDILLVPQPSNSLNDPLNWPLWKKDFMLFLICIDTAVVGAWVRLSSFVSCSQPKHMGHRSNYYQGPYDCTWLYLDGRTIQHVIQFPQWWTGMGIICYCIFMLHHTVNGSCLGAKTYFPPGQSVVVHQQHLGIFRKLVQVSPGSASSGMHWNVTF